MKQEIYKPMSNEKEIRKQAIVKLQEELRELVKLKRKEAEERFNSTEKALEIARREYEAYAKARYDLREKILNKSIGSL